MKVCVRSNVFETNSSSMHSIAVSNCEDKFTMEEIKNSFRGYTVKYQDYKAAKFTVKYSNDWREDERNLSFDRHPFQILYSFSDKLRFVIASMQHEWKEEGMNKFLDDLKAKYTFIKGFKFDKNSSYPEYSDNKLDYGSIDHQSRGLLQDFLKENNIVIDEFLSSKKYVVIIDGDEYGVSTHLGKAKLLALSKPLRRSGEFSYVE